MITALDHCITRLVLIKKQRVPALGFACLKEPQLIKVSKKLLHPHNTTLKTLKLLIKSLLQKVNAKIKYKKTFQILVITPQLYNKES